MRFRLRTLLIVLALGPPVLAGAWFAVSAALMHRNTLGRDPGRLNWSTANSTAEEREAVWKLIEKSL